MARLIEGEGSSNPHTIFENTINMRYLELARLSDGLKIGLDLVADLDGVNHVLATSSRPDLVMTERVPMMPLERVEDVDILNNFNSSMRSFGVTLLGDVDAWTKMPEIIGLREFTEEEKATAFLLGARGDYNEHLAFTEERGIDRDFARDLLMGVHINREAFMRMWILMPELTEEIMRLSLEREYGKGFERVKEEIFVAYQLMSRLVDRNDRGAIKDDGSIDGWLLCH